MDAGTNADNQVAGLRVVVRDYERSFVVATVKKVQFFWDVLQAEADTVACGIQVAKQIGKESIIINTNSQGIANLLSKRKDSRTPISWIVFEIQAQINEFTECKVQFTPRYCNVKAHQLAKFPFEFGESVILVDSYPASVICFLQVSN